MTYERNKARELLGRFIRARVNRGETPFTTLVMESALDYIIEVSDAMDAILDTLDSSSEWKQDTIKNIASFYLIEPETPLERMLRIQSELNIKYPDIDSIPDHVATEIADVLEGYL